MTAIAPPSRQSTLVTDYGFAYVYAEQELRVALAEKLDVLPFLQLHGDLSGSGSDTMRITFVDGIGWAEAFTALASEDQAITPTGFTTGFDTVTIARHGLGKAGTYTSEILSRQPEILLTQLKSKVPESVAKTYRELLMTSGAGITASVGAVTTAWDVDDHIAMLTHFTETEGYDGGRITAFFHPEQISDFRDSLRSEPSQMFPMQFEDQQAAKGSGFLFTMNNVDFYQSFDVNQAGGGHQGFAFGAGAFGRAVGGTAGLQVENPATAIIIPEAGLVIEERTDGGQNATRSWFANLYTGVGRADPTVVPQVRCLSIDN